VEAQSAKADLVPFQRRVSNPSDAAAASMLAMRSVAWDMPEWCPRRRTACRCSREFTRIVAILPARRTTVCAAPPPAPHRRLRRTPTSRRRLLGLLAGCRVAAAPGPRGIRG
jgi:hypothetical protein